MKKLPLAALFGTAFICLSVSPAVWAEDADSLDNIVVTADRKARTVDETLASVSIITRKDIEKYHASDIADVLRHVPGINITNAGGAGKETSIQIRGNSANQTLVLIDGVKINSLTAGSARIEYTPLDQVERIEVVRGPRSSLYGSEAIGGVIQIFTRKGGKGFKPEISLSAGSHNTQKANVNLAGGDKITWYNVNAGTEKTDGINATANNLEPDLDGFRSESASIRVGHRFANGTEAEISTLRAQGNSHYDGSTNSVDFVQQATSAKLKHKLNNKVVVIAQLGQARDETSNYTNTGVLDGRYNTHNDTISLQADVQTSANSSLTVGADKRMDKLTSSDKPYVHQSRDNKAVFTSYQHQFGSNNLDLSVRRDDNEQFGKYNTGSIALGHELSNGIRMTGSYGTAFKAPTFDDLYYPSGAFYVPNPALKPEKSQNTELGVSGNLRQGTWSVNAFENKVDDLIVYEFPTMKNVNKARVQGLELSAKIKLADVEVGGNLTLQKPENRSWVDTGKLLTLRPAKIANVDVDRRFGKFSAGATVHGESKRYTDTANKESTALPGYGTLDLRTDYKLSKDWTVGAKFGNVLNKHYQTNAGYNQDGANYLVTLKYAPK